MAGMALYCSDNKFVRPDWALAADVSAAYCGTADDKKAHRIRELIYPPESHQFSGTVRPVLQT